MKVEYDEQPIGDILKKIEEMLGGRQLGEMVSIQETDEGFDLIVDKMGKSKLSFNSECKDGKVCFDLTKEKIAFTHKPFQDEVKKKIVSVIEKTGGKVQS